MFRLGLSLAAVFLACAAASAGQQPGPPKILFDTSPRAVEYQLARLSNDELIRVERAEGDVRYRPVYYALLTRKGVGREYFDEALAALTSLDKASPAQVLLEGLSRLGPEDDEAGERLLRVLFAQPAAALRAEREAFTSATTSADSPAVLRGAYGALMIIDGNPQAAWQAAAQQGHLVELLRSVPHLGGASELRDALFEPIAGLLSKAGEPDLRAAAASALGWTRADAETFRLLAREVVKGADAEVSAAAVHSLHLIPENAWPPAEIEPLVLGLVAQVKGAPADRRTEPGMIDAIRLGENSLPPCRRIAGARSVGISGPSA